MAKAIYTRYSTDNQTENSTSTQIAKCMEFAIAKGFQVTGIYSDEAQTGTNTERTKLLELMSRIDEYDGIIIYDQSRLSRDIVDWFTMRKLLNQKNIKLYCADVGREAGDLDDPTVFLNEGVLAIFNQMHVLTTKKKTKDGLHNIAKQGKFTGGTPPLGYRVNNEGFLVIDDVEAETVREIFELISQGHSYVEVMGQLNKEGKTTKAGKPFGKNSIHSILSNQKYIGTVVYGKVPHKGKRNTHATDPGALVYEDAVPPIIDRKLWEDVQNMMKKRVRPRKRGAVYLLTGLVVCGKCGAAMVGSVSNKKYYNYVCSGGKRLHNCDMKPIRKELLETAVFDAMRQYFKENTLDDMVHQIYNSMQNNQFSEKRKSISSEISGIDQKLHNINEAIANGIYSSSTKEALKKLESRKAVLKNELQKINSYHYSLDIIEKSLHDVLISDPERYVKLYIKEIRYYSENNIRIIANPLGLSSTDNIGAANGT